MENNTKEILKEFYTINEIMDKLQLSRITIYRYIENGLIQTYKFGKDHRIRKEDYNNFLENNKI